MKTGMSVWNMVSPWRWKFKYWLSPPDTDTHTDKSHDAQEMRPKIKSEGSANSAASWEGLVPVGKGRRRETGDKANRTLTSSITCRGMVAWEKPTSMAAPHQRELPLQRGSGAAAQTQGYDVQLRRGTHIIQRTSLRLASSHPCRDKESIVGLRPMDTDSTFRKQLIVFRLSYACFKERRGVKLAVFHRTDGYHQNMAYAGYNYVKMFVFIHKQTSN